MIGAGKASLCPGYIVLIIFNLLNSLLHRLQMLEVYARLLVRAVKALLNNSIGDHHEIGHNWGLIGWLSIQDGRILGFDSQGTLDSAQSGVGPFIDEYLVDAGPVQRSLNFVSHIESHQIGAYFRLDLRHVLVFELKLIAIVDTVSSYTQVRLIFRLRSRKTRVQLCVR